MYVSEAKLWGFVNIRTSAKYDPRASRSSHTRIAHTVDNEKPTCKIVKFILHLDLFVELW